MNKILSRLVNEYKKRYHPHYRILEHPNLYDLEVKYGKVWKNKEIPSRQYITTERQLSNIENIPAIADLIRFMKQTNIKNPKVLEIGCSTGYHEEAFRRAKLGVQYEGCDFSPTFINLARKLHPQVKFKLSDATRLSYLDRQFDVVISGCCILHIIDYQKAIREAVRVSARYVIFHRTPVIHSRRTTFAKKIGYGQEMVEIFFNENELSHIFSDNMLNIVSVKTHAQMKVPGLGEPVFMKNYLCIKSSR